MEQASASGTREALMERRAAPYPYSKMCELCELCELLERKIPPLRDGIFFIYPQQNFRDLAKSLLTMTRPLQSRGTS